MRRPHQTWHEVGAGDADAESVEEQTAEALQEEDRSQLRALGAMCVTAGLRSCV